MNSRKIILESLTNAVLEDAAASLVNPVFKELIDKIKSSGLAYLGAPTHKDDLADGEEIFPNTSPEELNHGYCFVEGTIDNSKLYRLQRLINREDKQWMHDVYPDYEVISSDYNGLYISIWFESIQDGLYNIKIYGLEETQGGQ